MVKSLLTPDSSEEEKFIKQLIKKHKRAYSTIDEDNE